jgi:hypothetical protein
MLLSHRAAGRIQTISNELVEEWETYFTGDRKMVLAFGINQVKLVSTIAGDINILPELNISVGA